MDLSHWSVGMGEKPCMPDDLLSIRPYLFTNSYMRTFISNRLCQVLISCRTQSLHEVHCAGIGISPTLRCGKDDKSTPLPL